MLVCIKTFLLKQLFLAINSFDSKPANVFTTEKQDRVLAMKIPLETLSFDRKYLDEIFTITGWWQIVGQLWLVGSCGNGLFGEFERSGWGTVDWQWGF